MILLDTHVWIWFHLDSSRIAPELLDRMTSLDADLAISAVSIWETVLAVQKGRLRTELPPEEVPRRWLEANPMEVVSLDAEVAILSRSLSFEHDDPADRFIAATAYKMRCPLVTSDPRLHRLDWLTTLAAS